jgi:hypothetical protein
LTLLLQPCCRALGFEPKKEEIKKMIADIDKDGRCAGSGGTAAKHTRLQHTAQDTAQRAAATCHVPGLMPPCASSQWQRLQGTP